MYLILITFKYIIRADLKENLIDINTCKNPKANSGIENNYMRF